MSRVFALVTVWLPGSSARCCCCCQPHEKAPRCVRITSLGKDHAEKFKVQFLLNAYCFCTIVKSKNPSLSHCKPGTVCLSIRCLIRISEQLSKIIHLHLRGGKGEKGKMTRPRLCYFSADR